MKTKTSILLLLICILIACCSCSITTDLNRKYTLINTTDSEGGDLYLSSGSFYTVDADTLRSYTKIINTMNVSVTTTAKEAAKIGASVLDSEYDNWSESKSVVVHFNKVANSWIIHGQVLNRKSTEKCGVIAIEAATGEVLCVICE